MSLGSAGSSPDRGFSKFPPGMDIIYIYVMKMWTLDEVVAENKLKIKLDTN